MEKIKLDVEKKKKTKCIWYRVDEDEYKKIKKLAEKKGVLISQLMRAFSKELLKRV